MVSVTADGGTITANENVSNSGGGAVTLTATGATSDVVVAAGKSVTSTLGSGVVTVNADRTITLNDGATVATSDGTSTGTGTVTLNAGQAVAGNIVLGQDSVVSSDIGAIALNANHANGGTITMADVSTGTNAATVQSVSGAVTLSARTNVALGVVSTGGTVGVTATTGNITDNTANETIANIAGTDVTLTAGGAIGGTGVADIDTTIAALTASAGGDVVVRELSGGARPFGLFYRGGGGTEISTAAGVVRV